MRCGLYADQLLASVLIPWRLPRVAHGAILARLSGQSGRAEPGVRDDRGAGFPDRASRGIAAAVRRNGGRRTTWGPAGVS